MSILANANISTTSSGVDQEIDSLGGYSPLPSGLYPCKIDQAYLEVSAAGAIALVLDLQIPMGSNKPRIHKEKLWIQGGERTGKKNWYENKQGQKKFLPGFNMANNIALLTVGKELPTLIEEDKVINKFSYEAKKEVPTKVVMLTELLGQEFLGGILHRVENAKTLDGNEWRDDPSGKTKELNVLDKAFRASDLLTVAEIKDGKTQGAFSPVWEKKWAGETQNAVQPVTKGQQAPSSASAAVTEKPKESLFAAPQS
jgi:hypothetical protein